MSTRQLVGLIALSVLAACEKAPPERAAEPAPPPVDAGAGSSEPTAPTLENTHWQLVQLGGQTVSTPADRPDPHFVLFSDEKQAQGFGGCNRMMGSAIPKTHS